MTNEETILQSLNRIEKTIYSIPYDDLTDYLKGIRDMINMINGENNSKDFADYVIKQMDEAKLEYELPF